MHLQLKMFLNWGASVAGLVDQHRMEDYVEQGLIAAKFTQLVFDEL